MRSRYLLLSLSASNKIIKNIDIPSCRNCIHYKPTAYNDFSSRLNRCEKFGSKDIITDEITYDFVDFCRDDETRCGKNGKYFEEEKNIDWKIIKHKITSNYIQGITLAILVSLYINIIINGLSKTPN